MATTKSFTEVFDEIKANLTVSKKGKVVKSMSRQDYDKLLKAYLNTPEHTIQAASFKAGKDGAPGEVVKTDIKPVEAFRGFLRRVLLDFGVDKQEVEAIATKEIRNVDGMYEFMADFLYQFMNAGKKFDFITTEDFSGSMFLDEIEESITQHKNLQNGETFSVKRKKHKVLGKKSKCPKWLKNRV